MITVGAWLLAWSLILSAFAVLSSAGGPAELSLGATLIRQVAAAVVWTGLSLVIAAYHRRVRRTTTNLWLIAAMHVPGLFAAAVIAAAGSMFVLRAVSPNVHPIFWMMVVFYLDFDVGAYAAVIAVTEVVELRRRLAARQRQAESLERSLARARLDFLTAQLQPHFLFNSLGAVSELAYQTPAAATRVLQQLASIFRTALATRDDEITLGEEIAGIEPYLDIQRIRFADWLRIEYHVDDAAVDCLVPRFVLQPLVENAIRHGLSGRRAAGSIEISAKVDASTLIVSVADDGVGMDMTSSTSGRRGIGLANVRDRLRILYSDAHDLHLSRGSAGGTVVQLCIPARRREDHPRGATQDVAVIDAHEARTIRLPRALRNPFVMQPLLWAMGGLFWTQQTYMYNELQVPRLNLTWLGIARLDMTFAAIWALLTPCVMFLARRVPLRRNGLWWRVCLYVVGAAVIDIGDTMLWRRAVSATDPFPAPSYQLQLVVGMLIIGITVAFAHRSVFAAWMRQREEAAALLRAELDDAQTRATKLQSVPPVLLESLDSIAVSARGDPGLTERQLTRLADYVRLALECTDARGVTPDRQRALDGSLTELYQALGTRSRSRC
ncbi:MAG TPA: sensor histidine kinase [Gemmatimonadaceae bacterium]|nr:sensor histidine kinase [Gemmatimonadaceae bacterium]